MPEYFDLPTQGGSVESHRETRFEIYPNCGKHGTIILKDGRRNGLQFTTKPGAFVEVDRVLANALIDEEEARILRDQIARSNLSDNHEEGDGIPSIIAIVVAASLLSILNDESEEEDFLRNMRSAQRNAHLN